MFHAAADCFIPVNAAADQICATVDKALRTKIKLHLVLKFYTFGFEYLLWKW